MFGLWTYFLAAALQNLAAQVASTEAPTATLDSGLVFGTTTLLPSATAHTNQFLGIPFAKSPPVRFAPPQHVPKSYDPINATAWKASCIQTFNYPAHDLLESFLNTPPVEESEDCLYLNVYAPSTPSQRNGRAVMFWIYGGSLQFGNAVQPLYDGSAFAAYQDVIVVTFNYRMNVFGFPGSPDIPTTSQNLGYLDQRAALEWVHSNIEAFGGDPDRITIFGQSAGGWSVDALLTSYTSRPPFHAAILQSGQFSYLPDNLTGSTEAWTELSRRLKCTTLECLRSIPAAEIRNAAEHLDLQFLPIPDSLTLVESPGLARAKGQFAHVPILCGTTGQEARDFEVTTSNTNLLLKEIFGKIEPEVIPAIKAAYPIGEPGLTNGYDVNTQIVTDFVVDCPMSLFANETLAQGVPVWRYLFNASFPNTQLAPGMEAFHGSELPIVFGTYPGGPVNALTKRPLGLIRSNVPPTGYEIALSQVMQTAWAAFARCPDCGPGWSALGTSEGLDVMDFGIDGSSKNGPIRSWELDKNCALYRKDYLYFNGALPGL